MMDSSWIVREFDLVGESLPELGGTGKPESFLRGASLAVAPGFLEWRRFVELEMVCAGSRRFGFEGTTGKLLELAHATQRVEEEGREFGPLNEGGEVDGFVR